MASCSARKWRRKAGAAEPVQGTTQIGSPIERTSPGVCPILFSVPLPNCLTKKTSTTWHDRVCDITTQSTEPRLRSPRRAEPPSVATPTILRPLTRQQLGRNQFLRSPCDRLASAVYDTTTCQDHSANHGEPLASAWFVPRSLPGRRMQTTRLPRIGRERDPS